MLCDYITYTTEDPGVAHNLYKLVAYGPGGEEAEEPIWRLLLGAEGWQRRKTFVGVWRKTGRYLLQATGRDATAAWAQLQAALPEALEGSLARIDLQETLVVPDADGVISGLVPRRRYKANLMKALHETGATLYVGSPRSERRLRVYNKTAESGEAPPVGEYLRVELQLRDAAADQALAVQAGAGVRDPGALRAWWREVVCYMVPELERYLPPTETAHIEVPERQREARYKEWIFNSVIPALSRASIVLSGEDWGEIVSRIRVVLGD